MVPVPMSHGTEARGERFSGREFTPAELDLIHEVVQSCSGLSQKELAQTVCELLGWQRPSGALKARECGEFLERLQAGGLVELPDKRPRRPKGSRTRVPLTERGEPVCELVGEVSEFSPIELEAVATADQRLLFRELVDGTTTWGTPCRSARTCAIWRTARGRSGRSWAVCSSRARPGGWQRETCGSDGTGPARQRNLQRIVNNSRFLILPWVRIRNLASVVLSLAVRRARLDWPRRYGVEILLVETLVDQSRYRGDCYRAANWICLGQTSGRGRMDRRHLRHGAAVKTVFVYPLVKDAARHLREA